MLIVPISGLLRIVCVLCALCGLSLCWQQPTQAAEILVIESYHPEHPWDASYRQALQQRLGKNHTLHFRHLDTKRLPREQFAVQADAVWQQYLALKPQLVIIGDDDGINLLAPRISAHGTPVVYLGMNGNPRRNNLYGLKNMTGVLERPLMKRNIREMGELVPHARQALVLFDGSEVSMTAIDEEFRGRNSLMLGPITVDIRLLSNFESWQQSVLQAKAQGYDMIFIGLYHTLRDAQGLYIEPEQVASWTGEKTPLPLFSFWDFTVGPKQACGGLVMSGAIQGDAAATLAEAILAGQSAHALPPRTASRGDYWFSDAALSRWNLQLPADMARQAQWTD